MRPSKRRQIEFRERGLRLAAQSPSRVTNCRKAVLSFEGPAGAGGEFDLVFGPGFFGVLFESQRDELVD